MPNTLKDGCHSIRNENIRFKKHVIPAPHNNLSWRWVSIYIVNVKHRNPVEALMLCGQLKKKTLKKFILESSSGSWTAHMIFFQKITSSLWGTVYRMVCISRNSRFSEAWGRRIWWRHPIKTDSKVQLWVCICSHSLQKETFLKMAEQDSGLWV